jgi:Protein of unknown function (DUF2735)
MMNTNLNHGSAKIYQFPAGGRSAVGGRRFEENKPADSLSRDIEILSASGWYHEAAILESKPGREH